MLRFGKIHATALDTGNKTGENTSHAENRFYQSSDAAGSARVFPEEPDGFAFFADGAGQTCVLSYYRLREAFSR